MSSSADGVCELGDSIWCVGVPETDGAGDVVDGVMGMLCEFTFLDVSVRGLKSAGLTL